MRAIAKSLPSQESLHRLFGYEKDSGHLVWRDGQRAGRIAGTANKLGYRAVSIGTVNGRPNLFGAHRLVYMWVYGIDPGDLDIDHIDGNPSNNRIDNLRAVSVFHNVQNIGPSPKGKLRGAHWNVGINKWVSSVWVEGRGRYLGCFDTAIAAHEAYLKAKQELHAGFVESRFSKD